MDAGRLPMLPKDGSWNIGIAWPGLSELLKRKKKDIRLGGGLVRGLGGVGRG